MKKPVVAVVAGVLGAIILIAISVMTYSTTTPKYALLQTARDIKRLGYEGFEMHLTDSAKDALGIIPSASDLVEDESIKTIIKLIEDGVKDTAVGGMEALLKECKWSLVKVSQSGGDAEATLRFNYQDDVIGTVTITMLHEDGEWRIDGIGDVSLEKTDLYGLFAEE